MKRGEGLRLCDSMKCFRRLIMVIRTPRTMLSATLWPRPVILRSKAQHTRNAIREFQKIFSGDVLTLDSMFAMVCTPTRSEGDARGSKERIVQGDLITTDGTQLYSWLFDALHRPLWHSPEGEVRKDIPFPFMNAGFGRPPRNDHLRQSRRA